MKIDKIANGAEYRMNEQFQNLLIYKIPKISNLEN